MRNFHISTKILPSILTPRLPESAGPSEPKIHRICVAPRITACLFSLQWLQVCDKNLYIYETNVETSPAFDVDDLDWTNEQWILEPAEFSLIHYFIGGQFLTQLAENWFEETGHFRGLNSGDGSKKHLEWLQKQIPPKKLRSIW